MCQQWHSNTGDITILYRSRDISVLRVRAITIVSTVSDTATHCKCIVNSDCIQCLGHSNLYKLCFWSGASPVVMQVGGGHSTIQQRRGDKQLSLQNMTDFLVFLQMQTDMYTQFANPPSQLSSCLLDTFTGLIQYTHTQKLKDIVSVPSVSQFKVCLTLSIFCMLLCRTLAKQRGIRGQAMCRRPWYHLEAHSSWQKPSIN